MATKKKPKAEASIRAVSPSCPCKTHPGVHCKCKGSQPRRELTPITTKQPEGQVRRWFTLPQLCYLAFKRGLGPFTTAQMYGAVRKTGAYADSEPRSATIMGSVLRPQGTLVCPIHLGAVLGYLAARYPQTKQEN